MNAIQLPYTLVLRIGDAAFSHCSSSSNNSSSNENNDNNNAAVACADAGGGGVVLHMQSIQLPKMTVSMWPYVLEETNGLFQRIGITSYVRKTNVCTFVQQNVARFAEMPAEVKKEQQQLLLLRRQQQRQRQYDGCNIL